MSTWPTKEPLLILSPGHDLASGPAQQALARRVPPHVRASLNSCPSGTGPPRVKVVAGEALEHLSPTAVPWALLHTLLPTGLLARAVGGTIAEAPAPPPDPDPRIPAPQPRESQVPRLPAPRTSQTPDPSDPGSSRSPSLPDP